MNADSSILALKHHAILLLRAEPGRVVKMGHKGCG